MHICFVGSVGDTYTYTTQVPAGKQSKCLPNDFVIPGVIELAMFKGLILCTIGVKACPGEVTEHVEKTEKLNQKYRDINALPRITK